MSGLTVSRIVGIGLRSYRVFGHFPVSKSSALTCPGWSTGLDKCMSVGSKTYFRRLSSVSAEKDEQKAVKRDISMQQMNTISPTPFDTHSMVKQLQSSGLCGGDFVHVKTTEKHIICICA